MATHNNVLTKAVAGRLCKAMGIRMVANPLIVQLAANAGFDALFIDLEHSTLSLADASAIACAGLLSGLTPFVRVPHQCGVGFVQQALDSGAMGIVFPHVHSAADARAAVQTCKFPPLGIRSMWGQQPALGMRVTAVGRIVEVCNASASSVIVMVEEAASVEHIDAIAAVEGVDVLLVGCLDLSTDMGAPGKFETRSFRAALEKVSAACRRAGKVMGLAGIYNNREMHEWAINTLGVRFMLCQQDSNLLAAAAIDCAASVAKIERDRMRLLG
ncbi:Pyruvate/Phosphoenolpyruvate kinase-like domain-containing protein [Chaetomium sp. MPI-SDFR-AT-0129]|uniref:Pyruvate/Phosphoenolpyruvate kinase-like domain-containing protein n=1 Tax=Dichotomopilus funicola TaxID=1934379 RepID=A0AAN6UX04_9PEZI|nr:Pyruvate/Phosphoenolpyruvate kinase-like domain-containing protein [Chaetomium sp. MPI-SDFR-AT-0129]KAK4140594.1 Pyruvate/Phosphoenolpyruvate kinase-like domain-containing protein [Dichotomopilus funicola]